MDAEHNRRNAWHRAFCGMGVINGLENTLEPVMDLVNDHQEVVFFQHLYRFITEVVPFNRLHPAGDLLMTQHYPSGFRPLILSSKNHDIVAVYVPVDTTFTLNLGPEKGYIAQWFNPRTGGVESAQFAESQEGIKVTTPHVEGETDLPLDWVLTLSLPFIREI